MTFFFDENLARVTDEEYPKKDEKEKFMIPLRKRDCPRNNNVRTKNKENFGFSEPQSLLNLQQRVTVKIDSHVPDESAAHVLQAN